MDLGNYLPQIVLHEIASEAYGRQPMTAQILIAISAALALWLYFAYNRMVEVRNRVTNAFAQIDVQLKRRHDLIPSLVETAKGYMSHERGTLEAVIAARNAASNAASGVQKNPMDGAALGVLSQAEGALTGSLGRLFALSEAYPELKANQNMLQLSEELTSTENKIAFARQGFNDSVLELNTTIQSLPAAFIAGPLGFKAGSMLEFSEVERAAPIVKF
jgi:LemA protein